MGIAQIWQRLRRQAHAPKNVYRLHARRSKISIAPIRDRAKCLFSLPYRFRARIFFYIASQAALVGLRRDRQPRSNHRHSLIRAS